MAIFTTYHQNGNREDLLNLVVNISPTETPMLSGFAKSRCFNTLHQWVQDSLAAVGDSKVVEGSDATFGTLSARTIVSNYTQINRKTFQVSDTQDSSAVRKAGVSGSEYNYQLSKAMKELARDMEKDIITGTSASGASGSARNARGVLDFLSTNVETGSGTGTQALTETMYNDLLQTIYESGGNPDTTYVAGFQKRQISGFTASSTRNIEAQSRRLVANIDVYESDFGLQRVILDRHMSADVVAVLEKKYWKFCPLRPTKHVPLSKIGSSRRGMIESEWTLEALAESSSGKITELTDS